MITCGGRSSESGFQGAAAPTSGTLDPHGGARRETPLSVWHYGPTLLAPGLLMGAKVRAGRGKDFDLVAQDEVGAGVAGLGGGEVFTQLCDGSGCAARWQRVESDSQRAVAGVDVATAGEGLTDQSVGFVVRTGVPRVDPDRAG